MKRAEKAFPQQGEGVVLSVWVQGDITVPYSTGRSQAVSQKSP